MTDFVSQSEVNIGRDFYEDNFYSPKSYFWEIDYKRKIHEILAGAGIRINGNDPCDIQIKNEGFYKRVAKEGSLGLGESYMDGWWDCAALDEFFYKLFLGGIPDKIESSSRIDLLKAKISGSKSLAFNIGKVHYDIGDDLYRLMLDKRMTYSCGYWKKSGSLDDAQEAKLDLICRKLNLQEGQKLLDIGCGWGSLLNFAAANYKVSATGITVSKNQAEFCNRNFKNIDVKLQDYRELSGQFDHVVSVGMFEHVGYGYYLEFMKTVHNLLKSSGLFLLHTISDKVASTNPDPWVDKYIFPGGMLPTLAKIGEAVEGLFIAEDLHNFGADYDFTLLAWYRNFKKNSDKIKSKYGERFYRMWEYYLLSCAAAFRSRRMHVWQIVFSKNGVIGGYQPVR